MGSDPYAISRLKLEGEFKSQTNHHPPEPYYRLPFADDVIQHQGMSSLRREMARDGPIDSDPIIQTMSFGSDRLLFPKAVVQVQ